MRSHFALMPIAVLAATSANASIFGEENIALAKLVIGQVEEIRQLSEQVGVAKDQAQFISDLNAGIESAIAQIESIQTIISRAQDLDPTSVRSISDLNELLRRAKDTKARIEDLMILRSKFAGVAVEQSALQSDTSYKMGQEMIQTGAQLSKESRNASPGRASQISAATGASQMLAQGVQLQTLSHLVQLQALSLELQRTQIEREAAESSARQTYFRSLLNTPQTTRRRP